MREYDKSINMARLSGASKTLDGMREMGAGATFQLALLSFLERLLLVVYDLVKAAKTEEPEG